MAGSLVPWQAVEWKFSGSSTSVMTAWQLISTDTLQCNKHQNPSQNNYKPSTWRSLARLFKCVDRGLCLDYCVWGLSPSFAVLSFLRFSSWHEKWNWSSSARRSNQFQWFRVSVDISYLFRPEKCCMALVVIRPRAQQPKNILHRGSFSYTHLICVCMYKVYTTAFRKTIQSFLVSKSGKAVSGNDPTRRNWGYSHPSILCYKRPTTFHVTSCHVHVKLHASIRHKFSDGFHTVINKLPRDCVLGYQAV